MLGSLQHNCGVKYLFRLHLANDQRKLSKVSKYRVLSFHTELEAEIGKNKQCKLNVILTQLCPNILDFDIYQNRPDLRDWDDKLINNYSSFICRNWGKGETRRVTCRGSEPGKCLQIRTLMSSPSNPLHRHPNIKLTLFTLNWSALSTLRSNTGFPIYKVPRLTQCLCPDNLCSEQCCLSWS